MNYEQNGTGEPLVLIPYLGADHACYANNVIHALSYTVSGTRRASASRRVRAKLEDARTINEPRKAAGKEWISDEPFRGSSAVDDPNSEMVAECKNSDLFANLKAQAWWALRLRFQATHRAVVEAMPYVADDLIAIEPNLEELTALMMELSQPTYRLKSAGKIIVDKTLDGTRFPQNLADAVLIAFNPTRHSLDVRARLAS